MKFGIVIATYRRADKKTPFYLNRTLDSILKQTFQNYKVFLIGDNYDNNDEFNEFGLNFDTNKFYSENLPIAIERKKYYNEKRKLWCSGGCNASNYGIDIALSENIDYICRLDHDDWWETTHLENFKLLIETHKPDWMCSKSNHIKGVLPDINDNELYIKYIPKPGNLIKSSTCINQKTIPLRSRDVFAETGKIVPGDADLWDRMGKYIKDSNLKSYLINQITCNHIEEGYTKL